MKEECKNKRYIYDPLYGIIYLPGFIWDVIPCTELQRLREVRLCNINSFCLTGGANINRYEHAIGTYYLAQECLNSWPPLNPISEKEQRYFLLAALFHDVISAAFGHSVEYIESKAGFSHEKAFEYVIFGEKEGAYRYKSATFEPIFFGMKREMSSKIPEEDLKAVGKIIRGEGRFGPLINGIIDLDNIDNVFRLAYHIGLIKSGKTPLELAKSLWVENGELVVEERAVLLIEEWYKIRKKLYKFLLLNPEEFSAKCMLTEAIELAKMKEAVPFNWYDVDYDLLKKLSRVSSETSVITSRLMKGKLYGCVGIYSTIKTDKYEIFNSTNERRRLENELSKKIRSEFSSRFKSAIVALHPIIDINKIERQVRIRTEKGKIVQIGNSSHQLLIGVFFKNVDLDIYKINRFFKNTKIHKEIFTYLSNILGDPNLKEVLLYGEVEKGD